MVALYAVGMSARAVGRELGINRETVRRRLHALGIARTMGEIQRGFAWTPERKADVIRRYTRGESCQDIAWRYEVSHNCILRTLRRWGVPIRRIGNAVTWTDAQKADVARRYQAGETLASIGSYYHVHYQTIRTLLHTLDVAIRSTGATQRGWAWTPERIADVHHRYQVLGQPAREIAEAHKTTKHVIYNRLYKDGILPRNKKKVTPYDPGTQR